MNAACENAELGTVVALCGGIGGAKLALGLSHVVDPERLTVVVNVGDDFRHFGLHISPDIDTVIYTLAGRNNHETGWGRADESWRFMEGVAELGGDTWFRLGDTDLSMSAVRTAQLDAGATLTEVTSNLARALGVRSTILPVTNEPVRTLIETAEGEVSFQHYFVARHCEPVVRDLRYAGAQDARVTRQVERALSAPDLAAVVICPSNPYLSIGPMLAIPRFREFLQKVSAPVLAISPIVGGRAIKGPLAKMMAELGHAVTPLTMMQDYGDFVDAFILDQQDSGQKLGDASRVHFAQTVMTNLSDRVELARTVLALASDSRRRGCA